MENEDKKVNIKKVMKINNIMKYSIMGCCIIILISFFLPFMTAYDDHKFYLEKYSEDYYYTEDLGYKNEEMISISLNKFYKVCKYVTKNEQKLGVTDSEADLYYYLIIALTIFILLAIWLSYKNKKKRLIIVDLLILGIIFAFGKTINHNNYKLSIGYYIQLLLSIIVLITAIGSIIYCRINGIKSKELKKTAKGEKSLFASLKSKLIKKDNKEEVEEETDSVEIVDENNKIKKGIKIIVFSFIIILIVLFIIFICKGDSNSDYEKIDWDDIKLNNYLPEPDSNKGLIKTNSDDKLSIYLSIKSEDVYKKYIDSCKGKGYTVELREQNNNFSAYNEEGYYIRVSYLENQDEMYIVLTLKD